MLFKDVRANCFSHPYCAPNSRRDVMPRSKLININWTANFLNEQLPQRTLKTAPLLSLSPLLHKCHTYTDPVPIVSMADVNLTSV